MQPLNPHPPQIRPRAIRSACLPPTVEGSHRPEERSRPRRGGDRCSAGTSRSHRPSAMRSCPHQSETPPTAVGSAPVRSTPAGSTIRSARSREARRRTSRSPPARRQPAQRRRHRALRLAEVACSSRSAEDPFIARQLLRRAPLAEHCFLRSWSRYPPQPRGAERPSRLVLRSLPAPGVPARSHQILRPMLAVALHPARMPSSVGPRHAGRGTRSVAAPRAVPARRQFSAPRRGIVLSGTSPPVRCLSMASAPC